MKNGPTYHNLINPVHSRIGISNLWYLNCALCTLCNIYSMVVSLDERSVNNEVVDIDYVYIVVLKS